MIAMAGVSGALQLALFAFVSRTMAHEHHSDKIPEGEAISPDPIDSILWIHIAIQSLAWGLLFPTGMVLGMTRSQWHVPVQGLASVLAVIAWFLGHQHKGRQFERNAHSIFAYPLMLLLVVQVCLGVYLKFHLTKGIILSRLRKILVLVHGVIGKLMPVVTWVQLLFGAIASLGFCRADHAGQCVAHFIMGSAFITYGILLTIILLVGQPWLRRSGFSQEFFDSVLISAWGCVNTFTEHRWGSPWDHSAIEHTSMGIIWWCAGILGIWMSRTSDGRPKRNLIPGILIFMTGYAMSAHTQLLMVSKKMHSFFGYTLMGAGATRIIEISFVLKDRFAIESDGSNPNSFQFLPPFLLYASGILFMGSNEEQMKLLDDNNVMAVSYILVLYSFAFLLFLFVNALIHLYVVGSFHKPAQVMDHNDMELLPCSSAAADSVSMDGLGESELDPFIIGESEEANQKSENVTR